MSRKRGGMSCPAPIPALTPTSSLPSTSISKEPALRLKPNRIAAAATKTLFARRDFFLGGRGTQAREAWVHSGGDSPWEPLFAAPASPTQTCVCTCVSCVKEPKLHRRK